MLEDQRPVRIHGNDAGADVYMPYDCILQPGEVAKIPLGFGLELPDGCAGYVFPRSSMAAKGLTCELPPVDSGYRGEIHAIIKGGAACDHAGGHCGFCFGSWRRQGKGGIWKHRKIDKEKRRNLYFSQRG